jgi:hypothetical protein
MLHSIKRVVKPVVRKMLARVLGRGSQETVRRPIEWAIGIYTGESPLTLISPAATVNPVLTREDVTDVPAGFIADPFMIQVREHWYMFLEVKNQRSKRGEIGLATSDNGRQWHYERIVLAEPFHLSYPYVFAWMGDYYMIPESCQARSVRLYKAVNFPWQWSLVGILREGHEYVDSSIFFYQKKWWLLSGLGKAPERADTLCLFHADDLMGPWVEHPCSPIINGNGHIARPSGRVQVLNNTIIRYAQDCDPFYGLQVHAFAITELTTTSYRERPASREPVLTGSGHGWNKSGMHHIDAHCLGEQRWIACVDGWCHVEDENSAASVGASGC